jgi:YD repeat-containing protein
MKILAAVAAMILFFAVGATAEMTNDLSSAEIQGHNLVRQLLEQLPAENFTNSGVLQIRDAKGTRSEIPVKCETVVTTTNWQSIYEAGRTNKVEKLLVVHTANQSNSYFYDTNYLNQVPFLGDIPILGHLFRSPQKLSGAEIMTPFAGSDFWLADLGLEFFHWPEQKILKKEVKRSRGCSVLESTNPNPSTNGYSRVVSWVDNDGGGIVQAYAYDAQGKLLKEFYPKNIEKVNGQYQVQEMDMINDQTGSRTRLEFDLNKK